MLARILMQEYHNPHCHMLATHILELKAKGIVFNNPYSVPDLLH